MNQDQDLVAHMEAMEAEIRSVAHKIWEDEGRPEGFADDHWARASAIVFAAAELEFHIVTSGQPVRLSH